MSSGGRGDKENAAGINRAACLNRIATAVPVCLDVSRRHAVEQRNQLSARGWCLDIALQNDLLGVQIFAVEILVGIIIGTQSRAVERDTGKNPPIP